MVGEIINEVLGRVLGHSFTSYIRCTQGMLTGIYARTRFASAKRALAVVLSSSSSRRTMSKYAFLQTLGLSAEENGVSDGNWYGGGELHAQVRDGTTLLDVVEDGEGVSL
jgi:hypothetical protein